MEFGNTLFGNENGSWNGTAFTVPVDGIYSFSLHVTAVAKVSAKLRDTDSDSGYRVGPSLCRT